jgi:glycosyltransferase involved in cell wall biosynthesis
MPFLIAHAVDGLLVPPKDATAMVNAIIQLKTDDDLRLKLVSNARSKVENFSWKVVKTQWESLLS